MNSREKIMEATQQAMQEWREAHPGNEFSDMDARMAYINSRVMELTTEETREAAETGEDVTEETTEETTTTESETTTETEEETEVRTMTRTEQIINKVNEILEARKDRSTWDKAVTMDALDLFDQVVDGITEGWIDADVIGNRTRMEAAMLNGANDWKHYSWSGCGLCYNGQIAKHYCTPSEYKRTHGGMYKPNKSEEWLDVQARALWQAARRVHEAIDKALDEIEKGAA